MTTIQVVNEPENPLERAPLVEGGHDFAGVTDIVSRVAEQRTPRGWYLMFAISVALLLNLGAFQNGIVNMEVPNWTHFTTPFFWGIGLAAHGLYVFEHRLGWFRRWEDRKIKEYMDQDENDIKKTSSKRWE